MAYICLMSAASVATLAVDLMQRSAQPSEVGDTAASRGATELYRGLMRVSAI